MRAGSLDRLIDLLSRGSGQSATGAVSDAFTAYATNIWAGKRDLANDEGREDDQTVATRRAEFRIYYRGDVTPGHRVRYPAGDGAEYAITGVQELGRREGLLIIATAEMAP